MTAFSTSRMPTTVDRSIRFRRLIASFFWKECRRLAPMAMGVAVLAALVMITIRVSVPPQEIPVGMQVVAWLATALLSVACAVTLYAVEEEEGTADFLRYLPQNQSAMLIGKVLGAIAILLTTSVVLTLLGFWVSGGKLPDINPLRGIVANGVMAVTEAFVWSLLVSLLIRQPLLAAVAGIFTASVSAQVAMAVTAPSTMGYTPDDFQAAMLGRLGFVGVAAIAGGGLALRWPRVKSKTRVSPRLEAVTSVFEKATSPQPRWLRPFGRLVWQTVLQSWKTLTAVVLLSLLLCISFVGLVGLSTEFREAYRGVAWLGCLFLPALMGASVFREDQRRGQYQFMAEHAGRPRLLWWARHFTWLLPTSLLALVTAAFAVYVGADDSLQFAGAGYFYRFDPWRNDGSTNLATIYYSSSQAIRLSHYFISLGAWAALTAYGLGQLYSLFLRSNILAGGLALLTSLVITFWGIVITVWQLSPTWFFAPLALGALLATWLHIRNWMFSRTGVIHWALPILSVVLSIAFVVGSVPYARSLQLDQALKSFSSTDDSYGQSIIRQARQELMRGEEVADEYRQLLNSYPETRPSKPLDGAFFDEAIRLSKVTCRLPQTFAQNPNRLIADSIAFALQQGFLPERAELPLSQRSQEQLNAGVPKKKDLGKDLDRQLERLLACRRIALQIANGQTLGPTRNNSGYLQEELLTWALDERQTPELLRKAVRELTAINQSHLLLSKVIFNDYFHVLPMIRVETLPEFLGRGQRAGPDEHLVTFAHRLPGEQERAERALEFLCFNVAGYFADFERFIDNATSHEASQLSYQLREIAEGHEHLFWLRRSNELLRGLNPRVFAELEKQAELVRHAETSHLAAMALPQPRSFYQYRLEWIDRLARRRVEIVRLALIAHRLEEGSYPESLEELAPQYLEPSQYQDPYSLSSFGYEPRGFDQELWEQVHRSENKFLAKPHTPLLWCVGVHRRGPEKRTIYLETDPDDEVPTWSVPSAGNYGLTLEEVSKGLPEKEVRLVKPTNWTDGRFWQLLPNSENSRSEEQDGESSESQESSRQNSSKIDDSDSSTE